jgi:hypothetical protein
MPHICESLVSAVQYLEQHGLSVEQLRALHHPQRRPETFASTLKYFGQSKELKPLNRKYAERLIYIASEHRNGRAGLSALVEQALSRWPL